MRHFLRLLGLLAALSLLLPVGAASASKSGGAGLPLGTTAIELKSPTPQWYTPALHKKVVAAGKLGNTVPLPDGVEYDTSLAFTGIRPGAWIIFPAGCTTNFVFGGGTQIGTAGHCASVGEEVTLIAAPGVLMAIGTVSTSVNNGIGDDFALINIYPAMQQFVNPSMADVGGPTGSGAPAFGDAVLHSGHGVVIGTGGTPRAGVVTYAQGTAYGWNGAASPGDSGSPVRNATGAAAGDLTHLVVGGPYVPANVAGTTIARMQQIAGSSVVTASLVPDPL